VSAAVTRSYPLGALPSRALDTWHTLHRHNPVLDSPYFHPSFARVVHDSGAAVHVLVTTDEGGNTTALLPYHCAGRSVSRPMGWPGADFQGPLVAPGTTLGITSLLPPNARAFCFDHLLETCDGLDRWIFARRPSPFVDVNGGLDGYLGRASRSGKDNIGQARRRLAKAEREYGGVRFEADLVDDHALDRLVELKRRQYAATGAPDFFAVPGRVALLRQLMRTRTDGFRGVLSTVHVGDRLLAGHFGLQSGEVLHWWFPVYDPDFAPLAPGWILLRHLIAAAPTMGVCRIDLGRGEDEYKRRAKTGESTVCQGIVTSPVRLAGQRVRHQSVQAVKASRFADPLRTVLRRPVGVHRVD
jgi:CelD/BcsL family acetyltransferase involved in cellulose biosynthesis